MSDVWERGTRAGHTVRIDGRGRYHEVTTTAKAGWWFYSTREKAMAQAERLAAADGGWAGEP